MPETRPDITPELIPPLGPDLQAQDALDVASSLLPDTLDLGDAPPESEPTPFGKSWAWDFARGRFKRYGSSPAPVWDINNLKVWIQLVLNIGRFAHPIYEDDIGVDQDHMMIGQLAQDPAAQALYMTTVADALMVHDRITDVTNFDFTDDPDDDEAVDVYFEVTVDDGEVFPITLSLTD